MNLSGGKFFIPFNGYKGYEIEGELRRGNLSNMRTTTFVNVSGNKGRSGSKKGGNDSSKSKNTLLEAKIYKNKVQSRLRKLIGQDKGQDNNNSKKNKANHSKKKRTQGSGINQKSMEKNSKEKKLTFAQKKKNMRLNLSSDSMSKLCAQVENYLKNKFPMTAPHGKSKEKQLFQAQRRDHRGGTPKYSKKDDQNKGKVKGVNLALMNALGGSKNVINGGASKKIGGISKGFSKGGDSRYQKASKYYNAINNNFIRGGLSTKQHSKLNFGKTFKSSKQKTSKNHKGYKGSQHQSKNQKNNNFFLRSNYNNLRSSGHSKGIGTSSGIIKHSPTPHSQLMSNSSAGLNGRGGSRKEKSRHLADSYHAEKSRKSQSYVTEEQISNIDFGRLLKVETILYRIRGLSQKEFEIYDLVKEYVDIVQEEEFSLFYETIRQSKIREIVKQALVLERWAMFFIFFFYFNEKSFKKYEKRLKELTKTLHISALILLEFWAECISKFKSLEGISSAMRETISQRGLKHQKGHLVFDDFYPIVQNNNMILSTFKKCSSALSREIGDGIKSLRTSLKKMSLKEGLELCLDSFCKFLIEKGVVSVEYSNDQKGNQSSNNVDTPSTEHTKKNGGITTQKKEIPEPAQIEFPGQPRAPYLPSSTMKFTLVLDLDETLVHYEDNGVTGQFYLRPYAQEFIDEMSKYYELVIFTAALQDYADWILNRLDTGKVIKHRLYRQHTSPQSNSHVKDLSRLGRDLSKTIIVDNIPENFQLQPENGIYIKSWFKDPEDCALMELMPLLRDIVVKGYTDVRTALQTYRDKMIDNIKRGCLQPHLNLTLD